MENIIEVIKDLKGWQKLVAVLIIALGTVAVIYFQSQGGETAPSKTVGAINQSTGVGDVNTGNGDTNITTSGNNAVSF